MIHRDVGSPKSQGMVGRCVLCGREGRYIVPQVNRKTGIVSWACQDVRNCEVWQPDFAKNWNDGRTV